MPQPCSHRTLTSGPIAQVQLCETCKVIIVNFGMLSARFEMDAFESILETLTEARAVLNSSKDETSVNAFPLTTLNRGLS